MTPQPDSAFCDYVDITTPPGPRLEGLGISGLVERSPRLASLCIAALTQLWVSQLPLRALPTPQASVRHSWPPVPWRPPHPCGFFLQKEQLR